MIRQRIAMLAAAGAIGLAAFAAAPAAAQTVCTQWELTKGWRAEQSNGFAVTFDLRQDGGALSGIASYWNRRAVIGRIPDVEGLVTGRLKGNALELEVDWGGVYSGTIDAAGRISGITYDKNNPNSSASWRGSRVLTCLARTAATPRDPRLEGTPSTGPSPFGPSSPPSAPQQPLAPSDPGKLGTGSASAGGLRDALGGGRTSANAPLVPTPSPGPSPFGSGSASSERDRGGVRQGFTGSWDTKNDKNWTYAMTLVENGNRVTGSYVAQNGDRGTINGTVKGNVLTFDWRQGPYRGTGQFALSADTRSFNGIYQANPHPDLQPPYLRGTWFGMRR